ncbi:MAG: pyridine nucleotide-disulfide oxidoreductase, partial [Clostridia bacterium]|nr:pyridine nucleotide-disulfide oxidoreductase [Clostridia bacterium]
GKAAAEYINGMVETTVNIPIKTDGKIRYTVPQVITKNKDVTVFFRVSDVYKNVKITVKSGDDVIISKKKVRVAPGEMESIKLRASDIEKRKELIFSLEVV